jgi:hypothetical protein
MRYPDAGYSESFEAIAAAAYGMSDCESAGQ